MKCFSTFESPVSLLCLLWTEKTSSWGREKNLTSKEKPGCQWIRHGGRGANRRMTFLPGWSLSRILRHNAAKASRAFEKSGSWLEPDFSKGHEASGTRGEQYWSSFIWSLIKRQAHVRYWSCLPLWSPFFTFLLYYKTTGFSGCFFLSKRGSLSRDWV